MKFYKFKLAKYKLHVLNASRYFVMPVNILFVIWLCDEREEAVKHCFGLCLAVIIVWGQKGFHAYLGFVSFGSGIFSSFRKTLTFSGKMFTCFVIIHISCNEALISFDEDVQLLWYSLQVSGFKRPFPLSSLSSLS